MIYKVEKSNNPEKVSQLEYTPHEDKELEDVFQETVLELNNFFEMNLEEDLPNIYLFIQKKIIKKVHIWSRDLP